MENKISRATLSRIPTYLNYLRSLTLQDNYISAAAIARNLGLGEVQVRKDMGALCGSGKPKIGYLTTELIRCLKSYLSSENGNTVIVGGGKLGRALLDYGGFKEYGLEILAAFDPKAREMQTSPNGKPILPVEEFPSFCSKNQVRLAIIAVPAKAAQKAFDMIYAGGIRAVWCFAPCRLKAPPDAIIQYENMALSLAHLKMQLPR